MSAPVGKFQARALASLVVAVLVLGYLPAWSRGPLEIVVTFFHEAGHALCALVTGGGVDRFVLEANGTGYAQTRGGIQLVVLMGGYLGATIAGAAILRANGVVRWRSFILEGLGVAVAAMVVCYGGDLFTTGYGLLMAACLFGAGRVVPTGLGHNLTDAEAMAKATGLPALLWALAWALASLWILGREVNRAARTR